MEMSLGSFGDLRLDKGGCDPRTDGGAQDCVPSPPQWPPPRRGAGRQVLGQLQEPDPAKAGVTAAKIVEGWSSQTGAACAGRHVLAIQDTTEVKFPTTTQRRRGLGPVKHGNTYGVLVHAMIAVGATTTACLGLVGGEVWTRPGVVTEPPRYRPFMDRESHRWVATAERAKDVLRSAAMITVVDDREGDIYPKWACLPQAGVHLLTRAMVDRRLVRGGTLFAAAGEIAVAGRRQIHLPARQPERAKRTAVVELRYGAVEICRPRDEQDRTLAATVRLWLVDLREVDPPKGVEPLHWRLVSTHEITDSAKAWQVVGRYRARWIIEQLFRVMKSQGLQLEDSQFASGERLVKLAAAATKPALAKARGSVHRYAVGAGTRWQGSVAGIQRFHRAGD